MIIDKLVFYNKRIIIEGKYSFHGDHIPPVLFRGGEGSCFFRFLWLWWNNCNCIAGESGRIDFPER